MEDVYVNGIVNLGVELTKLAVKGTATMVATKIRSLNEEHDIEAVKRAYSEIVNELLNERDEAVRIAQSYKSELEKVSISESDMKQLQNTVGQIINKIKDNRVAMASTEVEKVVIEAEVAQYEQIKDFINVDTLKTMQLLGFNYKSAIGEPLTAMLRNLLLSKMVNLDPINDIKKLMTPEFVDVLKSKEAYKNLKELMGQSNI